MLSVHELAAVHGKLLILSTPRTCACVREASHMPAPEQHVLQVTQVLVAWAATCSAEQLLVAAGAFCCL